MKENNTNGQAAPGAELPPPTIDQVDAWLIKDIGACIALLNGIQNDPNLRRMMAEYLVGMRENRMNVHAMSSDLKGGPK